MTFCSYTIFAGQKKKPRRQTTPRPHLVPVLLCGPAVHAEGCFNLSCRSIDFSPVFSKCTFASCNPFIFRNFNLSSRGIKLVFPPSQLPIWFYDKKKNTGKLSFLIYKCIVNEAGEIWGWAGFWVTLRVLCLIY